MVCCCFHKGDITLSTSYDKAAYQAGEVIRVSATINNDSTSDVRKMVSKMRRVITLRDGSGASHRIVDTICSSSFEGVTAKSTVQRDSMFSHLAYFSLKDILLLRYISISFQQCLLH
jgi:Arrestin (or S-antigen), C-terminal domain